MSTTQAETPVKLTPDFSRQALVQLLDESQQLVVLARNATTEQTDTSWLQLQEATTRIHSVLVLLAKPGAMLFSQELVAVVHCLSAQKLNEQDAHTLVKTIDVFIDYLAHLQWPGATDSVLSAMPILNECRALRDANLLSENLLLAAGIQLPDVSALAVPSEGELAQFTMQLKASRQPLIRALLDWYSAPDASTVMQELSELLADMAKDARSSTQLHTLVLLFDSAAVVAESLATGELQSTALLKHQFAQLERLVQKWVALKPVDFPLSAELKPDTVFRNFLYTIATEKLTSGKSASLRRQFELELFNFKNDAALKKAFVPARVSAALGSSVRDSVSHEIEALQRWLSQAASDPHHSEAVGLRARLSQLEPALAMLDEQQALSHLVLINSGLAAMARDSHSNTREQRLDIAQATIRFRRSLDRQHQLPSAGLSQFTDFTDESAAAAGRAVTLEQHPQHRLLLQAQRQLQTIEHSLENVFAETDAASPTKPQQATLHASRKGLEELEQVLQILPLPEVSPLLSGMRSYLDYSAVQWPGMQSRRQFAELLVSIDYYLASVLSPQDSASQLLMNAEVIMQQLENAVSAETQSPTDEHDETQVITISGDALNSLIDDALEQMGVVGDQLLVLNKPANPVEHSDASQALRSSWQVLQSTAEHHHAQDLQKLADANVLMINRVMEREVILQDVLPLLNESHAVLPQLMDQHQGHSDHIAGFAALVESLRGEHEQAAEAVVNDDIDSVDVNVMDRAHATLSKLDQSATTDITETTRLDETQPIGSLSDIEAEVTGTEDELAQHDADSGLEPAVSVNLPTEQSVKLDSTLQLVFFHECQGHIDTLKEALHAAEETPSEPSVALPTPSVLRALHTLTGTAQTVDEQSIIALAQPLQKLALVRQRNNQVFDAEETALVERVVTGLQDRLTALQGNNDTANIAVEAEQAIVMFASHAAAEPPEFVIAEKTLEERVSDSLRGVFVDEAVDLLAQMRTSIDKHHQGSIELLPLLEELKSPVHTLKGSARMAGFGEFATRIHELEPMLDEGAQANVMLIEQELAVLQPMLLAGTLSGTRTSHPERSSTQAQHAAEQGASDDTITVSETGFAKMMSLATQASVSQAKLGEQLIRLNEIYRDLDSSTQRLRKQVHQTSRQPTVAEEEMLADLDAARAALASSLQAAESEHLQGSRADAELQQSLIRAQLVKFGACQDRVERAAQDSAKQVGVEVVVTYSGTLINLDRSLFRQLLGPLEHLVRNAVAHGIEKPNERLARNKAQQGSINVEADLDGNDLVITVKDDGAGIDIERLNNERVAAGKPQLESAQALRDALCEPGFSTRTTADEIAGRGMGLAVVDQLAISLGGTVQVASVHGAGTTISMRLPQKVIVNQVVLVRSGQAHYAIPVKYVHTVLAELTQTQSVHEFNGRQYASYRLSDMLGLPDNAVSSLHVRDRGKTRACILAQAGDDHVALDIDAVVGYREVIAQPIGPQLMSLKRFRGGSVLADGTAALILDMPRLMQSAPVITLRKQARSQHMPTALVVDDSITMRVAAEHFLQEHGIRSRMARDGIEALSMLQQQLPDVLLLDIDMPRLNGLELLQHLRQMHPNHKLAVVMISTRNGKVEQEQARALGASHFIGKPYHAADLSLVLSELGIINLA